MVLSMVTTTSIVGVIGGGFVGVEWVNIAISWREPIEIVGFVEDGAVGVLWVVAVCVAEVSVNGSGSG